MNINIIYTNSSSGQVGIEGQFPSNISSITLNSVAFLGNNQIDSFSIPAFGIYCSKINPSANSIGSASAFSGKTGGQNVQVSWTGTADPNSAIAVLQVSYTTGESGGGGGGDSNISIFLNKQFVKPGEELQVTAYVPYGYMKNSYIVSNVNENKTPSSPLFIYSFINVSGIYQTHCAVTIPSNWDDDPNARVIIGGGDEVVASADFKIGEMPFPTAGALSVSSTGSLNDLYFQWSDIKFQLSNVYAGDQTANISSVYFHCGSNSYQAALNNGTYEYTINAIEDFGELTYYATITNSYGASINTESGILNIKEYNKPQIEFLQATRINNAGEADAGGNYIKVDVTPDFFSWATGAGQDEENSITSIKIFYSKSNQETWYPAKVLNTDDEEFVDVLNKKFEILNNLSSEATIYVKVEVKDKVSMVSEIVSADLGTCTLFFDNGGSNVSIGMFGNKLNAVEINGDWNIYHGNNLVLDEGNIPMKKYPVTFQSSSSVSTGSSINFDVELLGTDREDMFYCGYSLGDIAVTTSTSNYYPRFTIAVDAFYVEENSTPTPDQSNNHYVYTISTSKKIRITITNNSSVYWPEISGTIYLLFIPFSSATPF